MNYDRYQIYFYLNIHFYNNYQIWRLKVDRTSKRHGGEIVAQTLKAHGISHIFTLTGGHISPILAAAEKVNIKIVDTRHEVFSLVTIIHSRKQLPIVHSGIGLSCFCCRCNGTSQWDYWNCSSDCRSWVD